MKMLLINFNYSSLLIYLLLMLLVFIFLNQNSSKLPKISIGFRTLCSLRLSTICSRAYSKCREKGFPLCRFRLFFRPAVFIADPGLLSQLDFKHFQNRGSYYNIPTNLENLHIFNMKDNQWLEFRKTLSRCFTLDKLKQSQQVFDFHAQKLLFEEPTNLKLNRNNTIDIFELCKKYSFLVASHIFLSHTPQTLNLEKFNKLYTPGNWNKFVDVFGYVCPSVLRFFNICDIPREVFDHLKDILSMEIDNNENFKEHSFLYQLMSDNANISSTSKEQLIGLMIGLFVGSLKSTSSFLAYACYEIAKATDFQEKLRAEVNATLKACQTENNDYLSHMQLQEMHLMRLSLDEILRIYTGGPLLIRECTENFTFSNVEDQKEFQIEKGTLIFASLKRILTDPQYFSDPSTFKPERFEVSSNNRNEFLPFGIGRRICIGNKFVMLQAKVFLLRLLSSYKISLNEKTPENLAESSDRLCKDCIYINLQPISNQ